MRPVLLILLVLATGLQATEVDRVQVVHDRANLRSHVAIASPQGKVDLGDVFRGVARLNGFDDRELRDAIPQVKISLKNRALRWSVAQFNWLMQPCVRCDIQSPKVDQAAVQLTVERETARNWVNRCKSGFRSTISYFDGNGSPPDHGLEFIDAPDSFGTEFVVLVHGLNSRPEDLADWVPTIRQAGLIPAAFRYPNDQPVDDSARQLSQALRRLRKQFPRRRVRLVTHSMGGLVARGALELPGFDPGNVVQLIMIAPPNQGSALASVALFMDCYEFFSSAERRRPSVLVASVADGLGEATSDLEPNSVFLDKLNAQPRHPRVLYTILLGTKAPMQPAEMRQLRDTVRNYSSGNRYLRFISSKLNMSLSSLDEVVDGQGDGVVATWRGRLKGVVDVIQLPFSHAGVLDGNQAPSQRAYAIIADRLARTPLPRAT